MIGDSQVYASYLAQEGWWRRERRTRPLSTAGADTGSRCAGSAGPAWWNEGNTRGQSHAPRSCCWTSGIRPCRGCSTGHGRADWGGTLPPAQAWSGHPWAAGGNLQWEGVMVVLTLSVHARDKQQHHLWSVVQWMWTNSLHKNMVFECMVSWFVLFSELFTYQETFFVFSMYIGCVSQLKWSRNIRRKKFLNIVQGQNY